MDQNEANQNRLNRYIAEQIEARPIEAKIIRKVYAALEKAGTPIVRVDGREEVEEVSSLNEVMQAAFNLDELFVITEGGSWVRFTMGEEYDMICDYTTDLDDALAEVNAWIERNAD